VAKRRATSQLRIFIGRWAQAGRGIMPILVEEANTLMSNMDPEARAVLILSGIAENSARGRDHLAAWQSIGDLLHSDVALVDLAPWFFMLTAVAHIEAATLHAAKLTDRQANALSITYLLNVIEQDSRRAYLRDDWPALRPIVSAARVRLTQLSDTLGHIKEKRDKELAHTDRRELNKWSDAQAVDVAELDAVFDFIDQIGRDLTATSAAFGAVHRLRQDASEESPLGPRGVGDLVYFTRAGFDNPAVPSPTERVENIRQFDASVRAASEILQPGNPNSLHRDPAG
jgi:hypothetical protein